MAQDSVLLTRLLPPRVPAGVVPRGDVAERVAAALEDGRAVTVTAGAGFGKSVLLSAAVARLDAPWAFCSCDRLLDPALLVAHLTAAIEQRFPGFGAGMSTGSPAGLAEDFVNELVIAVPEDLVIVLDDVHDLPDRTSEAVVMLARRLPPHVTLAVAGRTPLTAGPPTPGRAVLALSEADLALTRDEATELLGAEAGLDAGQVDDLYARTEGWVAGLALAAQAGARGALAAPASDRDLFDYLAAEVLDAERPEMREFLLRTSVLDRFSPQVAAAVSERDDAAELCRELVARHLFTARLDAEGEWYRYHALFAEVLAERLAARPPDDLAALHRRAGRALLEGGNRVAAARHLIEAEDFGDAVDAVAPVAEEMAVSADAATLIDLLDAIPEAVWRPQLPLGVARAAALHAVGARARSLMEHEQVIALSIEREDWATAAEALMSLLLLQGDAGDWDKTTSFFRATLAQIPMAPNPTISALHAMAAGQFGGEDDPDAVRAHLARAREAAANPFSQRFVDAAEVFSIGRLYGEPRPTVQAIEALAALFAGLRMPALTRATLWVLLIRAGAYHWFGYYEEAIERYRDFAHFARTRLGARHTVIPALFGELSAHAGLGRWDDVERLRAEGRTGLTRLEDSGAWWAYLQPVWAALAAGRGDADGVRAIADVAGTEFERFSPHGWERALVCTGMANACGAAGVQPEALGFAEQAVGAATATGSAWLEVRAQAAQARVTADETAADAALARALELTERHGLDAVWTHRDRRLAPASLARAIAGALGPSGEAARLAAAAGAEVFAQVTELTQDAPPEARAALVEAGERSPAVARQDLAELAATDRRGSEADALARTPSADGSATPRLRLLSLGGFGLERDGERVPNAAFGRARARAVLAALLAAGEPVPRDRLLEWFWSDLDAERGTRAFHVTMSALRRAVEPGLERGTAPSVVVTEGDSYRVVLGEDVAFDALEFVELVDAAARDGDPSGQRAALTAALALHGGEPFPEWPYEPWAEGLRGRVHRARLRALEALGENLVEHGHAAEAVEPLSTLVELDSGHEAAHRGLMRAYAAAGERARGLRQFHACRSSLVREQGVEPSPATRELYASLLGDA